MFDAGHEVVHVVVQLILFDVGVESSETVVNHLRVLQVVSAAEEQGLVAVVDNLHDWREEVVVIVLLLRILLTWEGLSGHQS